MKLLRWDPNRFKFVDTVEKSAGAADAGKIPHLSAKGKLDSFMGAGWKYQRPVVEIYTDFLEPLTRCPFAETVNGTGASNALTAPPNTAYQGVVTQSTGTTAAGRAALLSNSLAFVFAFSPAVFRAIVQYPLLPSVVEDYIHEVGFLDSSTGVATDGVFFRVTNTGNLVGVCRSNNTETISPSLLTLSPGSFYDLRIEIDGNPLTTATFFAGVIGLSVSYVSQPVTLNIPSGVNRSTGAGALLRKTAGLTARTVVMDCMYAASYPVIYF
jgi:hypothetical protein